MVSKKVLVLAGGSVKGAFQTGAIKAVFESGFKPDAIYGVSAGGMNASFLVNHFGKQNVKIESLDFEKAAIDLCDFWLENINHPSALARRRGTYELGLSAIRRNFEGLLDTQPLRDIVESNISVENLLNSPISLKVGAVDIINGGIVYAEPTYDHFLDYIMASSAIPILMPVVNIGNQRKHAFLDGGLRDVAPIKKAIGDGATEIVCIACHTREMHTGYFPYGNLLALVDRIMDIAVNESLNADLDWAELHNLAHHREQLNGESTIKSTPIKIKIIRPDQYMNLDIQKFDEKDIENLINIGYRMAKEKMNEGFINL